MSNRARDVAPHVHAALAKAAPRGVSRTRKRVALAIAALSDAVQWAFFPAVVEGAASPLEIGIDAVTALAILVTVGFQWRLAFALAVELVPGIDLFPTWFAMVLTLPVADGVPGRPRPQPTELPAPELSSPPPPR